jgi:pyruvate/2-oxoglutarate dehydrogenase complex dihydrolipoamide acyltransferase (E2) component
VTVAEVEERKIAEWDEFIGRFEAVESVEIRARVSGTLERLAFQEGKEVRKGELLFRIDPRPYRADLARAEAELAQARSTAVLAQSSLERSKRLIAADATTREDFESRTAGAERGSAAVSAAQAAVASARLNLGWTEVRSPIRGAGRAVPELVLARGGHPHRALVSHVRRRRHLAHRRRQQHLHPGRLPGPHRPGLQERHPDRRVRARARARRSGPPCRRPHSQHSPCYQRGRAPNRGPPLAAARPITLERRRRPSAADPSARSTTWE